MRKPARSKSAPEGRPRRRVELELGQRAQETLQRHIQSFRALGTYLDQGESTAAIVARLVAILTLLIGLWDTSRVLGVWHGEESPLSVMGPTPFALLLVLALARLFAAVGLWMGTAWGAVLLVSASLVELFLALIGGGLVDLSLFGFMLRLAVLAAMVAVLVRSWRMQRADAQE